MATTREACSTRRRPAGRRESSGCVAVAVAVAVNDDDRVNVHDHDSRRDECPGRTPPESSPPSSSVQPTIYGQSCRTLAGTMFRKDRQLASFPL
jgi:hypothetical protein